MSRLPLPFSNHSVSEWILQLKTASEPEERLRALQAIAVLSPSNEASLSALLSLDDADPTVRALAAKILGTNPSTFPDHIEGLNQNEARDHIQKRLIALVGDADPDVRFESARALIRQKSNRTDLAVPVLFAFLDEPETHALMVAAVANAITEADLTPTMVDEQLLPRVQRLVEHERAEVREAVANAFAKWPLMAAKNTDLLLPLLDDVEPIVREKIAQALGQAGVVNDRIKSALVAASQDEDAEVARQARNALQTLQIE